jgi:hypothetical protein
MDWRSLAMVAVIVITSMLAVVYGLAGCDEKDAWASIKPVVTEAVIAAAMTAKTDPGVREAMLRGDFDAMKERGIRVMKIELKNSAAKWKLGTDLEKRAYRYLQTNHELLAAMIAREVIGKDGKVTQEGLYWRLDRWLLNKGHLEGVGGGLLAIRLTTEERDELWPLALIAVEEEYIAARLYLEEE